MSRKKTYKDIPGTTIFDAELAAEGYHLNQFCMSLMRAENREKFKADESLYLADWAMSEEQKRALLDRDYNRLLELGGNIYFLAKVFSTDGFSYQYAAALMAGMPQDEYKNMMLNGGRSPEGNILSDDELNEDNN